MGTNSHTADLEMLRQEKMTPACILYLLVLGVIVSQSHAATRRLPKILDILASDPQFSTLLTALETAYPDPARAIASVAPVTLFAPPNEVFASLPEGLLSSLLTDPLALRGVLERHLVPDHRVSIISVEPKDVETLSRLPLRMARTVSTPEGTAAIVEANIRARDGIIHVIDGLI